MELCLFKLPLRAKRNLSRKSQNASASRYQLRLAALVSARSFAGPPRAD